MVLVNLPQLLVDSILTGSVLALGAIGLTLVYRVMKFPNFVHAEFLTFGAYSAYAVNQYLGLGLLLEVYLPLLLLDFWLLSLIVLYFLNWRM